MIDIHSHILPFVDDGSSSIEESMQMIYEELENGVKSVILTPHALRRNMSNYTLAELQESFNKLQEKVKNDINLYLGQEIAYDNNLIKALKKGEVIPLNNTKYILLELPFVDYEIDFDELVYSCKLLGYEIILAHVERYGYLSVGDIVDLKKKYGIHIQVNSGSIVRDHSLRKFVFKLFKENVVTFVSSDIHSFRKNTMKEAFEIIKGKFGEDVASDVFINNAKNMLNVR